MVKPLNGGTPRHQFICRDSKPPLPSPQQPGTPSSKQGAQEFRKNSNMADLMSFWSEKCLMTRCGVRGRETFAKSGSRVKLERSPIERFTERSTGVKQAELGIAKS